ncbi:MAG TPA: MauE/DoxX family redox-associated membrane protein [Chthoniobacterales bacterium]
MKPVLSPKASYALHWMARTGLGLLFFYAGIVKILDPIRFAESIKAFELTGPRLTEALTFGVPALELAGGCILALGVRSLWRGAASVLAGLLGVFSAAVASAWWRGLAVSCGCFGAPDSFPSNPAWWLARNALLAAVLAALVLTQSGRASGKMAKRASCRRNSPGAEKNAA